MSQLFKRLMPSSLLWRSMLIIGTPLVLVQFIAIWVFFDRHVDTVTRRMVESVSGEIRLTLNHLKEYKSPADLVWILSEVQSNLNIRVTYKKGAKLGKRVHTNISGRVPDLVEALGHMMEGAPFAVDGDYQDRNIRMLIETPTGLLDIVIQKKRIQTITTELFVMWSVGSSLVLLIIAALFMRNQVRPIRQLAHAADSFGKGRDVPDYKPWGATEVRQAATAFIIMRDRINRQIRQRTEMLAGISHDLRTPLTRLKLALALLEDGPETEDLRNDVAEMEHMVNEYLSFARGEGTEQAVQTDLKKIIEEIVRQSRKEGLEITIKIGAPLTVIVRPSALKRCLANIVGNAARFADQIAITVRRRGQFAVITIDDNGPGIPEDMRDEVFRPFSRLDHSRNRDSGGVGLGLTIARDVVRGHGGDIMLSESEASGLRVTIRLPL